MRQKKYAHALRTGHGTTSSMNFLSIELLNNQIFEWGQDINSSLFASLSAPLLIPGKIVTNASHIPRNWCCQTAALEQYETKEQEDRIGIGIDSYCYTHMLIILNIRWKEISSCWVIALHIKRGGSISSETMKRGWRVGICVGRTCI